MAEYVDSIDDWLLRIAQIETLAAVDNADEIAAVDGARRPGQHRE